MIKSKKTFVLSDESVNSYGFRILTEGIDLTNFLMNPIMLRNHEGEAIGYWENIRVREKKLLAEPVFSESTTEIIAIAKKVEEGTLRAASIGIEDAVFTLDSEYKLEGQELGTVINCKAFEASIVEFPSNANALALYDKKQKIKLSRGVIQEYSYEHLFTNNNQIKMQKETLALLNLNEDANATDVHNAIVKLLNESKGKKLELDQLTDDRNAQIVDAAFRLGKITISQTEHYKVLLKKDFNNTKRLLDSIPVPEKTTITKDIKISELIKKGHTVTLDANKATKANEVPTDRSKWTLEHYRRFAPQELKSNPALFDELLAKETNQ